MSKRNRPALSDEQLEGKRGIKNEPLTPEEIVEEHERELARIEAIERAREEEFMEALSERKQSIFSAPEKLRNNFFIRGALASIVAVSAVYFLVKNIRNMLSFSNLVIFALLVLGSIALAYDTYMVYKVGVAAYYDEFIYKVLAVSHNITQVDSRPLSEYHLVREDGKLVSVRYYMMDWIYRGSVVRMASSKDVQWREDGITEVPEGLIFEFGETNEDFPEDIDVFINEDE